MANQCQEFLAATIIRVQNKLESGQIFWIKVAFYFQFTLVVCLFSQASLNTYLFLYKQQKYKNPQLLGFYIFSIITLILRTILYAIVISQTLQASPDNFNIGVWALLTDLPDYTYLMTGACQLLIVGELIISHSLKPEYMSTQEIDLAIQKIKTTRFMMYTIFACLLLSAIACFIQEILAKVSSCKVSDTINTQPYFISNIVLYLLVAITLAGCTLYQIRQFMSLDRLGFRETNIKLALVLVSFTISFTIRITFAFIGLEKAYQDDRFLIYEIVGFLFGDNLPIALLLIYHFRHFSRVQSAPSVSERDSETVQGGSEMYLDEPTPYDETVSRSQLERDESVHSRYQSGLTMSVINQMIGDSGDALGGVSKLLRVDASGKLRLSDPNPSELQEPLDPNHSLFRAIRSQERDDEDSDSVTDQSAANGSLIIERKKYNKSFS